MLRNIKELELLSIDATDGVIGRVRDFYFDDQSWVIRYLVVKTEDWLSQRNVLISPYAIGTPMWPEKILPTTLTRAQVRAGPDIDTDKPVSRQHEMGYLGYYGYPNYWGGGGLWGGGLYPDMIQAGSAGITAANRGSTDPSEDPHLRSANEVMRYYVHATDGDIGHVQSLLVEDRTWAIRYLVVNTSNWWLGHEVVVAPSWIGNISWAESTMNVSLTRAAVKESPAFDSAVTLGSDDEAAVHRHYGRENVRSRNRLAPHRSD